MRIDNNDQILINKLLRYIEETNKLMKRIDKVGRNKSERDSIRLNYGELKDKKVTIGV